MPLNCQTISPAPPAFVLKFLYKMFQKKLTPARKFVTIQMEQMYCSGNLKGVFYMVIFFGQAMKVAVSLDKLSHIIQQGNRIQIFFYSGYTTIGPYDATVPKMECKSIHYETDKLAETVMRNFYTACEKGKGAYYFG